MLLEKSDLVTLAQHEASKHSIVVAIANVFNDIHKYQGKKKGFSRSCLMVPDGS